VLPILKTVAEQKIMTTRDTKEMSDPYSLCLAMCSQVNESKVKEWLG